MIRLGAFKPGWRTALTGAALVALLGVLCLGPLGEPLVNLSYDLPFFFRSNLRVAGAVILQMDSASEEKLDQPRSDWDRAVHARLLDRLQAFQPRAVVFDVLFDTTNHPAANQELARAAKDFGKVVVAARVVPLMQDGVISGEKLEKAFPALRTNVTSGVTESAYAADERIREHSFYDGQGGQLPSMAYQTAQLTMTNPPAGPYQRRWLNYHGPPGTIRTYSYYEIFQSNVIPAAELSNAVVFVGDFHKTAGLGGARTDVHPTPYTRWTGDKSSGVEITATAYLNFLHGDWLSRLTQLQEALLLLLAGAALSLGLTACRPMAAVGLGALAALVVAAVCIWLTWQTHVWVPWMVTVAVQIPCAVGWSALAHTKRLAQENRSLEQALAIVSKGEGRPESPGQGEPAGAGPAQPAAEEMWGRIASSARSPAMPDQTVLIDPPADEPGPPSVPDHQLLRCFGKGAYGEVWLARDIIGTFHAVKLVYRNKFQDARPLEREFNGIRRFTPISRSHPGFVNILHVGRNESAGYIYYVMELGDDVAGSQKVDPEKYSPKTLASELRRRTRLPLSECLEVALQLADALEYLHQQQLIHRDIKPANIIFVKGLAKFADIGLVTDIATRGTEASYLGTPGRIPPEGPGSPASDVYALGKVLYEMGFGLDLLRFPELPTDLIQSADGAELFKLNRIIMRACEPDFRKRYQSAAELSKDLAALQTSLAAAPQRHG